MALSLGEQDFGDIFGKVSQGLRRLQFGNKLQLAFLEDFNVLIRDGIPANRAIEMMAQVTSGVTKEVALYISQKISEGQPLAEGMRAWFSPNVVEIVRVGEEGGALNETVNSAIKAMSQRSGALGAVIGAITYPIVVIATSCFVMVYLNNGVFNQFRQIKPMDQWPSSGVQFVEVAEFVQHWWWSVIVGILAIIIILRYTMNNYIGDFRSVLDRVPPFSLYRKFAAARLMETLGLLVSNGVVFKSAIKVMQYQANPYVASHLVMMEHYLGAGKGNIADVLATGLIDEADILRLRILAEVKGFEHGLTRMGVRGSEQGAKTVQMIAKIVGGVLLVCGMLLVIIIVKGIYLTGMSMGS